jgi:hypothetical protein
MTAAARRRGARGQSPLVGEATPFIELTAVPCKVVRHVIDAIADWFADHLQDFTIAEMQEGRPNVEA